MISHPTDCLHKSSGIRRRQSFLIPFFSEDSSLLHSNRLQQNEEAFLFLDSSTEDSRPARIRVVDDNQNETAYSDDQTNGSRSERTGSSLASSAAADSSRIVGSSTVAGSIELVYSRDSSEDSTDRAHECSLAIHQDASSMRPAVLPQLVRVRDSRFTPQRRCH